MSGNVISRRTFSCAGIAAAASAGESRRIPVALQLFSVRMQCEENLAATLARVKRIGFHGVEFAGYYNHGPAELRRLLDGEGLLCCGAHVPVELLLDRFDSTVDFHRTMGNRSLIVPGLPASYTRSIEGWLEAARVLETLSTKLASAGMILGYHNHAVEFGLIDGKRAFDVFFQHTSPAVFCELDLGGAGFGGADPNSVLRVYPGRVRMIHAKDYTGTKPDLLIGDGEMNWKGMFRLTTPQSGVKWFVIEHDSKSRDLADIEDSFRRFQRLRS